MNNWNYFPVFLLFVFLFGGGCLTLNTPHRDRDIENQYAFEAYQSIVVPRVDIENASIRDVLSWLMDIGRQSIASGGEGLSITSTFYQNIDAKRCEVHGSNMTILEVIDEMCRQMDCGWRITEAGQIHIYYPDVWPPLPHEPSEFGEE